MYHAKHPEGQRKSSEGGSFLGFDEDSDDEDHKNDPEMNLRQRLVDNDTNKEKPIHQEELLDGLPLWLDRLFEGSTMRYYINFWPEFPEFKSNFAGAKHQHYHHITQPDIKHQTKRGQTNLRHLAERCIVNFTEIIEIVVAKL